MSASRPWGGRLTGMRHASTSAQQVRNDAACVAPRAERINASLDDPAEGPLMMPPWYLPSSWANGMARLGTLTAEQVQVSLQARTAITDKPTTRPSERLVGAAEVTEGMASPGSTVPAAYIFGLRCREAALDARVLQRWRHLFYPHGDESARRSAPRLTDVGSVLEASAVRPSLCGPCHHVDWSRRMPSARGCSRGSPAAKGGRALERDRGVRGAASAPADGPHRGCGRAILRDQRMIPPTRGFDDG